MSKLLEKVGEREACRARLLELRRAVKLREDEIVAAQRAVAIARNSMGHESARLIDLTREVSQLAHADLAGIVGTSGGVEPVDVPDTASA